MTRGGPNWYITYYSMNLMTVCSWILLLLGYGPPVKCSTSIREYLFPYFEFGSDPAKSMDTTSNRPVTGIFRLVWYGAITWNRWNPWQMFTYVRTSLTTFGHQNWSVTNCCVIPFPQFPSSSWNELLIGNLSSMLGMILTWRPWLRNSFPLQEKSTWPRV